MPINGGIECKGGNCQAQCASGFTLCGNTCAALDYDPDYCGSCGKACSVGEVCQQGACIDAKSTALASAFGPEGIAVDATSVYWTETDARRVMRLAKNGGTPELLAGDQDEPWRIAIDDQFVYWTNRHGKAVMRVEKSAGGNMPKQVISTPAPPSDLFVDGTDVFFSMPDEAYGNKIVLAKVPKAGGLISQLALGGPTEGQSQTKFIVPSGNDVFLARRGSVFFFACVQKDGTSCTDCPLCIANRDTQYLVDFTGGLAVDATKLYYGVTTTRGAPGKGGIVTVDRLTGTTNFLTDDNRGPDRVWEDGEDLYLVYLQPPVVVQNSPYSWIVGRVAKCGGGIVPIVPSADTFQDLAIDDRWVYWTEKGSVRRARK